MIFLLRAYYNQPLTLPGTGIIQSDQSELLPTPNLPTVKHCFPGHARYAAVAYSISDLIDSNHWLRFEEFARSIEHITESLS